MPSAADEPAGLPPTLPSYLVVVDDSPESRLARLYASICAGRVGATVCLLHIIPPTDFVQWGGVQELIEEEAREKAEKLLSDLCSEVSAVTGRPPALVVRSGSPVEQLLDVIAGDSSIHALVLGATAKGAPGPLVAHFSGEAAGALPCLVIIVPGGLDEDRVAQLATGRGSVSPPAVSL